MSEVGSEVVQVVEEAISGFFARAIKETMDDALLIGGKQCYQDIDPWGRPLTSEQRENAASRLAKINERLAEGPWK